MTFQRLLPVFKKLQLLPWISVTFGLIAVIAFALISSSGTQTSHAESPTIKENSNWQSEVSDKLQSLKAEASSLKEKIAGPTEYPRIKENVPADIGMIPTVSRSMSAGGGQGGFQKIANSTGTEVYIPMGSVFRAQLMMPIKTSIQDTFVMAQTTHEFRFDNDTVRSIPVGSRLIGRAQLNPLLKGVIVRFHTLVTPKGIEYPVSVLALSKDLFAELNGIYFSNDVETYGAILAFGAVEGFANASRDYDNRFLTATPNKTVSNNVWAGVSGASFRLTEQLLQEIQNRRVEYVVVPSGEKIFVVFDQRFVIKDKKPIR